MQILVDLDRGQQKARRAIDRAIAALAGIGEAYDPFDMRVVLPDHAQRDAERGFPNCRIPAPRRKLLNLLRLWREGSFLRHLDT